MAYVAENKGWSINLVVPGDESIQSKRSKSFDIDNHVGDIIINNENNLIYNIENTIEKSVYSTKYSHRLFRIFKPNKNPKTDTKLIDYHASTTKKEVINKVDLNPYQYKHIWYNIYKRLSKHYEKTKNENKKSDDI